MASLALASALGGGLHSRLADQSGIRARSGQSQALAFTRGPKRETVELAPGNGHQAAVYCTQQRCFSSSAAGFNGRQGPRTPRTLRR